jgi:trigger factor
VAEEEIQDALKYLQKSRAKMSLKNPTSPEGSAGRGDFVEIEYSWKEIAAPTGASLAQNGRENGKPTKDQFVLGEGGLIPGFEDNLIGAKAGEEKAFKLKFPEKSPLVGKDGEFKVKVISVHKMELPEINDEFAKQLGAFDTLVALKSNMKDGLTQEKREQAKQARRAEILEKIAEKAKFELPESMVEYEQQHLLDDLKNRISQTIKNITFEQYLASVKKTEQEIKDTYKKEAEKRLRGFLVLRQLGKAENIQVSDAEVEEEANKTFRNYPKKSDIDINEFKEYTKGILYNEKVFKNLELN